MMMVDPTPPPIQQFIPVTPPNPVGGILIYSFIPLVWSDLIWFSSLASSPSSLLHLPSLIPLFLDDRNRDVEPLRECTARRAARQH